MADCTNLGTLVPSVLEEMRQLNYSENTITGFRRMFAAFGRYAKDMGTEDFSEELAVGYL